MVTSPPLISTAISQGAGRTQPPTRTNSDLRPDLFAIADPIIRSVVGDDEDAYQDTWVKVLDHKVSSEDQVRALARSCKRSLRNQAITAYYRNVSLSKPLGHSDTSTPLTMESLLAAPEELSLADLLAMEELRDRKPTKSSTGQIDKCSRCGKETEWDPGATDKPVCLECWDTECDSYNPAREYSRRYRQEHKAELAEQQRRYRQEHKAELAEQKRRYYQEHKAEYAEQQRRYRQEHKAELTEQQRRYRQEHKAELTEQKRRYRQEHKAELTEQKRRYRQEHKAEYAEQQRRVIRVAFRVPTFQAVWRYHAN